MPRSSDSTTVWILSCRSSVWSLAPPVDNYPRDLTFVPSNRPGSAIDYFLSILPCQHPAAGVMVCEVADGTSDHRPVEMILDLTLGRSRKVGSKQHQLLGKPLWSKADTYSFADNVRDNLKLMPPINPSSFLSIERSCLLIISAIRLAEKGCVPRSSNNASGMKSQFPVQ